MKQIEMYVCTLEEFILEDMDALLYKKKSSTNQQDARPRMGNSRNTVTPEKPKREQPKPDTPLQTLITIIILIIAILKQLITQIKEITKRAAQAMENTIKEASHNKLFQNIKDFHRTTMLAITVVTNHTKNGRQAQTNNRNMQNSPGT